MNDTKRIGILVSEDDKNKWQTFIEQKNISTISKLIRKAVNFFIDNDLIIEYFKDFSKMSHNLKEPLTSIQGFSQLIIENNSQDLNPDVLIKVKEIFAKSVYLENRINEIIQEINPETSNYDVLIIEDDTSTIMVLTEYFESKGLTCLGVTSGAKGLEYLQRTVPKLILLDIILPDSSGFDICKRLKSQDKFKAIPIFFITAIPESEVVKNLEDSGAEGYFLKPFKFHQFNELIKQV